MSLDLVRVDDRLIHGQVVVGWGRELHPDLIVLADDQVAASAWEQDLYRMGVPDEIRVEFASIDAAARAVDGWANSTQRTIVLMGDVASLGRFCDAAPTVRRVNLGGIHREGTRRQRLPYVFLSEEEAAMLQALAARGIAITAQDLPGTAPVALADLL